MFQKVTLFLAIEISFKQCCMLSYPADVWQQFRSETSKHLFVCVTRKIPLKLDCGEFQLLEILLNLWN